ILSNLTFAMHNASQIKCLTRWKTHPPTCCFSENLAIRPPQAVPQHDTVNRHTGVLPMPEKETLERARRDKQEGKAPSTQAGEFIREEFHHVREGKHGARSAKQAIAIGLSKARRAGVELPPPKTGSAKTKRSAELAYERGHGRPARRRPSARRSRAISGVRKREG